MLKFAVISDKYLCTAAVALSSPALFAPSNVYTRNIYWGFEDLGQLIVAACLLKQETLFTRYTETSMEETDEPYSKIMKLPFTDRAP